MSNLRGRFKIEKLVSYLLLVILLAVTALPSAAFAARPDDLSILLSDSRKSTVSNYTITHDQVSTAQFTSGDTLVLTFPAGFNLASLASPGDYDFKVGATDESVQSAACGATDTVRASVSGQAITFEACSSYTAEAAGSIIEIQIGTHAVGGANQIINHATAATYSISSNTTDEDSQDALIAITDGVTLSALIDETLTFTIAAVVSGTCDTTGGTKSTTTATLVDWNAGAALSSNTFYDACQSLTVGTNASAGYSTTVQTTTLPTSGTDTIAKGVCDATCSNTVAAAWATATNNGYGYCMKDVTGTAANVADGTAWTAANQCGGGTQKFKLAANVGASEAAQSVMAKTTPTTTNDVSRIGYRVTVGPGQAAGTYTTTVVYIATPTF